MAKKNNIIGRLKRNYSYIYYLFPIGLFYAVAPHNIHIQSGLDFGLPHTTHVLIGIILLAISSYFLFIKKEKGGKRGH